MDEQVKRTKSVPWSILSSKHSCHLPDRVNRMRLLNLGGWKIKEEAQLFLHKMQQESDAAFRERVEVSAYRPYIPKFVNIYKSNLFSEDLFVHEAQDKDDASTTGSSAGDDNSFYKIFASNCDGLGSSYHNFMKERYATALSEEYGYFGMDLPKKIIAPINRLEEEIAGQDRNVLYKLDQLCVWDFHIDPKTGRYTWIKLGFRIEDAPTFDSLPMHHYEVKVWIAGEKSANWELYVTPQYENDKDPEQDELIDMVDEGDSSFRKIPIYCIDLSNNLSVGFKLGPLAQEHFQMSSYENSATARACVTIPVLKRDKLVPAKNEGISFKAAKGIAPQATFNAKGFLEIGKEESLEIVETEGSALTFIHKQNEDRVEQMHETMNQLHSASKQTSSKTGRSAAAMRESRYQMELLMGDHAEIIFDVTKDVYRDLSDSREDGSPIWIVEGLCTEPPEDTDTILKRAEKLSRYGIGSKLFDKKYRNKLAQSLIGKIGREEQLEIIEEIGTSVESGDAGILFGPIYDWKLQQKINSKPVGEGADGKTTVQSPQSNPQSSDTTMKIGESGQQALPTGSNLQTGQHIEWQTVYKLLKDDYSEKDLQWVKQVSWRGPVEVDVADISFLGEENWKANKEGPQGTEKVEEFKKVLSDKGFSALKPIILANMPHNNEKYTIIDGRHRVVAARDSGIPVLAYIADVGSMDSDTPHMQLHSKQQASGATSA